MGDMDWESLIGEVQNSLSILKEAPQGQITVAAPQFLIVSQSLAKLSRLV